MKQVAARAIIIFTMSILSARGASPEHDSILAELRCRQLIVVTTASWSATTGTMTTFERDDLGANWRVHRAGVPVVVGQRGLAWGLGAAGHYGHDMKHEGDKKAPAGVFKLREVFGYAREIQTKMHYRQATSDTLCVDDGRSSHYGDLIESSKVDKDWCSAEQMRRDDDLYKWGVVVDENPTRNQTGGSCIFLHIWRGPDRPTIGCTAMAENDIVDLIRWLDPARAPLLVQLPQKIYEQYRKRWNLPALR